MPPPLPLPPQPLADRPAPKRWPGYALLAAVVCALTLLIGYGFLKVGEIKAAAEQANAAGAVKAVLLAQQDNWNGGNLDGYMAGYWNDERLTFASGGDLTRGWQPTLDRYRKRYQAGDQEMGTLTFSDLEYEPLAADVVLVRGRWALVYKRSEDKPHGLFTLIVRRTPDGWKVVHDHTSVPEPKKN